MKPVISSAFAVLLLLNATSTLQPTLAQAAGAATGSSELTCTAASSGNPCFGTSNNPGQDSSAGNPINLSNGNKYQEEQDFFGDSEHSGLEFYRYYNSTQLTPSLIGQGWRHSYDRKLYWRGERPQILLDDSSRILFQARQDDIAQSRHEEYGTLRRVKLHGVMERLHWPKTVGKKSVNEFFSKNYLRSLSGDLWLWQYPSGAIDVFNTHGNLVISQMPFSEAVFIERELKPGPTFEAIMKVQNQSLQSMEFHYAILGEGARLSQIDVAGGSLEFDHELPYGEKKPRLLAAKHLDGSKITYGYDAAKETDGTSSYLITRAKHYSAADAEPYRDVSWYYDTWGRGTEVNFHRHEHLPMPLSMQFNYIKVPQHNGDTGLTEVTQTIANQTTSSRFHTTMLGSKYLLTKAEGAPCFNCPAPGTEAKYDDAGQLIAFNGLSIRRRAHNNRIESIGVPHRGWPGLRIYYDDDGKPYAWSSLHTGKTFYELDDDTLYPRYKNYANKTRMFVNYDKKRESRLVRYSRVLGSYDPLWPRVILNKFVPVIFTLSGEADNKYIEIKRYSQTIQQRSTRYWSNRAESNLKESFTPYAGDRFIEHLLPEHGKIHYQYDENHNIKNIYWNPVNTAQEDGWKILYQRVNEAERKYGNNLLLRVGKNSSLLKNSSKLELIKEDNQQPLWQEIRYYHPTGLLAAEHQLSTELSINKHRQYGFNSYGQIIRVDTDKHDKTVSSNETDLYAWQLGGASFARQHKSSTIKNSELEQQKDLIIKNIKRDESGFIQQMDQLNLVYDERNFLTEIRKEGATLANYAYDGLNQRIRKTTPEGETQYYYLNQQLVAEAFVPARRSDKGYASSWSERAHITRRYIYDGILPVALIDYSEDINGKLYFVHSDGSGQPFLVTNESQEAVWLADNDTFGQSHPIIEYIEFNLRLPGQYYDAESGLHQNLYRNYDPEVGHYLEPDPLGPVSSNDVFGYANQNPRQFVDPLGLLMFVFDGTTNTPSSQTNAYKLGQLYNEGPMHYIEGIGTKEAQNKVYNFFQNYHKEMETVHKVSESSMIQRMYARSLLEWQMPEFIPAVNEDKLFANMAPYMLNMQWMQLIEELSKITTYGPLVENTHNIDLSGFSRGAALASIFANKIYEYTNFGYFEYTAKWLPPGQQQIKACVNLRFVGLFDTVHQLGALGKDNQHFDYTASPAWSTFAHAIALNEHRKIMPLTRFKDKRTTNVYEQGFLGNHSDIGGSIFPKDLTASSNPMRGSYGDLGNIPLNWMYDMALEVEMDLKPLDSLSQWQLHTLQNPLLHLNSQDETVNTSSRWLGFDRRIYSATGENQGLQSRHKELGASLRKEHVAFVDFKTSGLGWSYHDSYGEGYPHGLVRGQEYLNFLSTSTKWNSSLQVISQQQQ